jgi:phage/plasmid-like protein (TIGR03299 family)
VSASIFGERFIGNREPAWHGIGTVFTDTPTVSQAVQRAALDYRVETFPVFLPVYGKSVDTGRVAIVRQATHDDPEPRFFGFVTPGYEVLQNTELASVLDPLSAHWPVETAGALGHGEKVFLSLDAGKTDVGGEEVNEFFLVVSGHDGGTAARVAYTPVRVVCQNTLVTGLRRATVTAAVAHARGVKDQLAFRVDLLAKMKLAKQGTLEVLRSLTLKKLVDAQVQQVLAAVWPDPRASGAERIARDLEDLPEVEASLDPKFVAQYKGAGEKADAWRERILAFRAGATECLAKMNSSNPQLADTAWYVYNAVAETADYRRGSEKNGALDASVLWGPRAAEKTRALQAVLNA